MESFSKQCRLLSVSRKSGLTSQVQQLPYSPVHEGHSLKPLFNILWGFTCIKMELEQSSGFPGNEYTSTFPPHSAHKGHKTNYADYKPWWAGSSSFTEEGELLSMERKEGSHLLKICCMPGTILAVLGTLSYVPMKSFPSSVYQSGFSCKTQTPLW